MASPSSQTQAGDEYPWSGDITFHVSNPNGLDKKVAVRIPQWSKDYTLEVNGEAVEAPGGRWFRDRRCLRR